MKQDAHASAVGSSPSDPFVLSGGRNLPRGGHLDYLQKARRGIRDPERTCDEIEHRVDLLVDAHEYRRSGTRLLPREQSLYLLLIPGYLRDARDVYLGDLRRGLDIYAEPHRELPGASVALVQRGGHLEGDLRTVLRVLGESCGFNAPDKDLDFYHLLGAPVFASEGFLNLNPHGPSLQTMNP